MRETTTGGVDLLLSRLQRVRSVGEREWIASCPAIAHGKGRGDLSPSLSVAAGNGSGPIFHCHAGCAKEAILTGARLTWQDILPPRETISRKPYPIKGSQATGKSGKTARYPIRDHSGDLIAIHVREDIADGKKMRWELPDGTPNLGGIKTADLPLYGVEHLEAARAKDPTVVCEGEKAADALRDHGLIAVGTVTGASGTPSDEALRPILGRPVLLWPDNDNPGREHMVRIGLSLQRLGHRDIRVIDWKGAPNKGDAADLFALEGAMDEYQALIDEARTFEAQDPLKPEAVPAKRLFESLARLLEKPIRRCWLVQQLVEIPSTILIFGPSGSGKSFVSVALAGAATVGGTWMGRQVTAGAVFYIAGEGRGGLLRRFAVWQIHHGIKIPADRLYLSTVRIELDEAGAQTVAQEVERLTEETGVQPVLIIIDTLARAMPAGGDENSAKDMSAFVNRADELRDRFGCTVAIVHHSGVADDKRARGSTSLKAAMDAELCITDKNGARVAEWTKLKDLPQEPNPEGFVLERVLLGQDDDGELITSAVVKWQGTTNSRNMVQTTKAEALGLKTLRELLVAGATSATTDEWRAVFYRDHWGDDVKTKKKAFARVRESLASKRLVRVENDNYSFLVQGDRGTGGDNVPFCPGQRGGQGGHVSLDMSLCPPASSPEEEDRS